MTNPDILIVGAGVAGLSAATALAETGQRVLIVEQAASIGGNIHRQPNPGFDQSPMVRNLSKRWTRIMERFSSQKDRITIRCNARFAGADYSGMVLIAGAGGEDNLLLRPKALIIATGATERVAPRPGWTLPGVMTVGCIQTALKSTGQAPRGEIILAGSGPLLLAAGAELVRSGNPPIAIVEAGRPFHRFLQSLQLPPSYIMEGMRYMVSLLNARVPIFTDSYVSDISPGNKVKRFKVRIRNTANATEQFLHADLVGLHEGLVTNDYGIDENPILIIRKTGDCRELLGGRAAEMDGLRVGREVSDILNKTEKRQAGANDVDRHRRAQNRLAAIFAHHDPFKMKEAPDDTVLCRCENRTVGDFRALAEPTIRESRLLGRFAMGNCQGRFCSEWVMRLMKPDDGMTQATLGRNRWPVRPVPVQNFIDAKMEMHHSHDMEGPAK